MIKELQRSFLLFRTWNPYVPSPWALSLSDSGFATKTVAKVGKSWELEAMDEEFFSKKERKST